MAKLSLTDLASLAHEDSAIAAINANSALIETALENTLSRDGTSPNTMNANLDMNSNRILNLPAPTSTTEPVGGSDIPDYLPQFFVQDTTPDTASIEGSIWIDSHDGQVYQLVAGIWTDTGLNLIGSVGEGVGLGDMLGANNLSELTNTTTARSNLGVVIGTHVQAYDGELAALAGLTSAADKLPYFTGSGTAAVADLSSFGRTLIDDANAAASQTTLGLAIGTNVQAFDQALADISALAVTDSNFIVGDGTNWVAESGATVRTSLGLGTANSPEFTAVNLGSATATTLTGAAGVLSVEGNAVLTALTGQPLDADLTAIAALTTTAAGRSVLTIADPAADRILMWDDNTNLIIAGALTDIGTEAAPAAGDFLLIYGAEGDLRKVNWSGLPGAGGGISNVVEDTTPDLGGNLTAGAFDILISTGKGIRDAANNEQLLFTQTGTAVNYWNITNSAAGGSQILAAAGDDAAITAILASKGTDPVILQVNATDVVTVTGSATSPSTNDASSLGTTSLKWSDLFLASGAVINFNSGDANITHSLDTLTLTGATLVVPDSGIQVGASVPFSDSAGSLTLQNVDGLDATTEATIEAAIDTLANLTSIQGQTVTLTGAFIRSGAHSLTLTTGATTNVTLPASGTLATLASSEVFTNKTLTSPTLTTPVLGTPSSGTLTNCTGLPIAGLVASTSTAIGVGSIELGAAADTTIARAAAGRVTVENVELLRPAAIADQEAATSAILGVTPSVQQRHPSAAKAWGHITVSGGVPTLAANYNVASITDTGVGIVTINLTTAFSSADYVIIATIDRNSSGITNTGIKANITDADTFILRAEEADGTDVDPVGYHFVCFGDQ